MKNSLLTLLIGFFTIGASFGQSVKIDSIYSTILKRIVPTTIILPPNYDPAKVYPVFYLLHRWAGSNQSFIKSNLLPELKEKQLIVVTPSADTSWYVNSFSNPMSKYEDFMTLELFNYIDKKYKTNTARQAIGGYSMGAFGALQIGLKHPERFKFIADMSGPINPPFYGIPVTPKSPWNIVKNSVRVSFGDEKSATSTGSNVFTLVKSIPVSQDIFIFMAVGKQDEFDFMIPQHQLFIDALNKQKIKHQYSEFEGGHFDGKVLTACLPSLLNKLTETLR
jgi:S-formylglutathione hydrolase FrmB